MIRAFTRSGLTRLIALPLGALLFLTVGPPVWANHPVLVEGNNAANGPPGTTVVPPGTSGDFDGDGLVGTAEDTDNSTDRIFGTLTAALLAANGGANANGHVIIVTSGRFNEAIRIPNPDGGQAMLNGVTIVEAAPGVQAQIDAVVAGSVGNADRVLVPGIIVDTPQTDRLVILRNLVVRNFTVGLQVQGNARVICEDCRFDSNLEANVRVLDNARLTMTNCAVRAGGMRFGVGGAPPNPGHGVEFQGNASGSLFGCTIGGNVATGVLNGGTGTVRVLDSNVFDNGADFGGKIQKK